MSPCGLPIFSQRPSQRTSLPLAQAASSTTRKACRRAMGTIAARSHGMPIWCTHRMARVRGVTAPRCAPGRC